MADANCIRSNCVVCSSTLSGLRKLYCGNACKVAGWKQNNPERAKELRQLERAPAHTQIAFGKCIACGVVTTARQQRGTSYCRECMLAKRAKKHQVQAAKHHALRAVEITCGDCGGVFCPLYGHSNVKFCCVCIKARARRWKRIQKLTRNARKRGVSSELVDPLKVFARDKWTCQLCKRKTPRKLRGSYEDAAPELDHITPLSLGGAHSYTNTQCACRRCNGLKSNKQMGQMLLVG